jgi:predicted murein hydrolase (TIGR00659 family)
VQSTDSILVLLPVLLTVGAFQTANWLFQRSGRHPLCNPVLVSVSALIGILWATGVSYQRYFNGAQVINMLLGPAVVALAIPLHRQLGKARKAPLLIIASIGAGAIMATVSAVWIARVFGADSASMLSIAPKSVTTPVAMGISHAIGGVPELAAVLAVLTGILGACLGPAWLTWLGVTNAMQRGLAIGTASHGIGTARALQDDEEVGAFSGLAMGLAALLLSLLMPLGLYLI